MLSLDRGSLAAVRAAAAEVAAWSDVPAIDCLVLNAGIMAVPYAQTEDGLSTCTCYGSVPKSSTLLNESYWLFSI